MPTTSSTATMNVITAVTEHHIANSVLSSRLFSVGFDCVLGCVVVVVVVVVVVGVVGVVGVVVVDGVFVVVGVVVVDGVVVVVVEVIGDEITDDDGIEDDIVDNDDKTEVS